MSRPNNVRYVDRPRAARNMRAQIKYVRSPFDAKCQRFASKSNEGLARNVNRATCVSRDSHVFIQMYAKANTLCVSITITGFSGEFRGIDDSTLTTMSNKHAEIDAYATSEEAFVATQPQHCRTQIARHSIMFQFVAGPASKANCVHARAPNARTDADTFTWQT